MAQITILKDKEGKTLYPITSSEAVLDPDGIDIETKLGKKVEKEQGKGLSSNDYTNADKQKLSDLPTSAELTQTLSNKQKKLIDSEDITIDDNKLSVTERAKMELFIELWEYYSDIYGGYRPDESPEPNKPFYLNKLWFSYEDALRIYAYSKKEYMGKIIGTAYNSLSVFKAYPYYVKTVFPLLCTHNENSIDNTFSNSQWLEILSFLPQNNPNLVCASMKDAFAMCGNLREILTPLRASYSGTLNDTTFKGCTALEEIRISFKQNANFIDCKKLSYESMEYMVNNALNTSAITITVHPDVYAKLAGDETNDAYNNLTEEEKAQWTALAPLAVSKNISFVTI